MKINKAFNQPTFLLLTRTDWEEPPRARHQLASALLTRGRVVFVSLNKTGAPSLSIKRPNNNLEVVVPKWLIPGKYLHRMPIFNEFYQVWLLQNLSRKYLSPKIVLFDISGWLTHFYFKEVIYYCNDDFLDKSRAKNWITKIYFQASQRRIATTSISNIAVSHYLLEKLSSYSKKTKLLLTGASTVPLCKGYSPTNPDAITLVYVGWLSKINPNWIIEAAKHPSIRIQLIGPYTEKDITFYNGIDNIEIIGPKKGNELHNYLVSADIGIAPYKKGRDTDLVYTVPNKFWLYLSYGLPIVTHKIQNIFKFPDMFVYEAESSQSFFIEIENALCQNDENMYNDRLSFVKMNTWEYRAEEVIKMFN